MENFLQSFSQIRFLYMIAPIPINTPIESMYESSSLQKMSKMKFKKNKKKNNEQSTQISNWINLLLTLFNDIYMFLGMRMNCGFVEMRPFFSLLVTYKYRYMCGVLYLKQNHKNVRCH